MNLPVPDLDRVKDAATRAGQAVVTRLWGALDAIDEAGFSLNPLEVVANVRRAVELLDLVRRVATQPPPGDPAASARAADAWLDLGRGLERASQDLGDERSRRAAIWTGRAAQGFDATVAELDERLRTAATGARRASAALEEHAERLAAAQRRHDDVAGSLQRAAGDLPRHPADLSRLDDLVGHLRAAVTAAIDSWRAATDAAGRCAHELAAVQALMPFPDGAAPGMRALDETALHEPGSGRPPLVGDVLPRARAVYDALPDADRARVDELLASLPDARAQAWALALLATGCSTAALARFVQRLRRHPEGVDDLLDPREYVEQHALRQTTGTTCGSSSLVYAQMLRDPAVAMWVLDGYDLATGESDATRPGESEQDARQRRFAELEARMKQRTDDPRIDPGAGWDPRNLSAPWPPALGTSPWAAAEELGAMAPPGTDYGVNLVDRRSSDDRAQAYDLLVRSTNDGNPAVLYVGDEMSPRHVVLVYANGDGSVTLYEPGAGTSQVVERAQFVDGGFSVGGWGQPWAVVAP